jgi:hypothetical protein
MKYALINPNWSFDGTFDHYLTLRVDFSDIQDQRSRPLHKLKLASSGQR